MRKTSKKQAARLREYSVVRREHLEQHPYCFCGKPATDIHHKRGRLGDDLTNKEMFLSVCRPCHTYIETHPAIAYEKGWSVKRSTI